MMNPTDRPTDSFLVETANQSLGQIAVSASLSADE